MAGGRNWNSYCFSDKSQVNSGTFTGGIIALFLVLFCLFLVLVLVFRDRVSLCSPGCPGTHFVDQAGFELRNPSASASRVLELKACATSPGPRGSFIWLPGYVNSSGVENVGAQGCVC